MVTTVVEVGPVTVRGPGPVPAARAAIAVAGIDDETVLVEDEPVAAADLWAELLDAAGAGADHLTLVCPTWWTVDQRRRLAAAATSSGAEVVVMQRVPALNQAAGGVSRMVVEIADELVVISGGEADAVPVVVARHADGDEPDVDPAAIVRAVIAMGGGAGGVIVDAPLDVTAAAGLGAAVAAGLRAAGMAVTSADVGAWRAAPTASATPVVSPVDAPTRRGRSMMNAAVGVAVAVALILGGLAVAAWHGRTPPMTVLVEGRVGVQIPAGWTVQRVTDGPGSARVQIVSPSDPQVMLHLTQSAVGDGAIADTLQEALAGQPSGVFVDFDRAAVVAGRPVVRYREVRSGREIRWGVLADGPVRIAVGCQSPSGAGEVVRPACEAAIRSAHVVR